MMSFNLQEIQISTKNNIDKVLEANQDDSRRRHLGASGIGHPCVRKLWYDFRWIKRSHHGGRLLRLFNRGHREEERFVEWLRDTGIEVREVDPNTGDQYRVSECGGHFGGSLDGVGLGLVEAPQTAHLLEFKTMSDKYFKDICKKGLQQSKPIYYIQIQIYMHLRGLTRCLFLAINKNDDSLYQQRVKYDKNVAEKYIERARAIINSPVPLNPIRPKRNHLECKWCDYRDICMGTEQVEKNCRTCKHVSPVENKVWYCSKYEVDVVPEKLGKTEEEKALEHDRHGCNSYELIPALEVK